jgi:CubicO group peptidase (beta-lactamase class C family)
MHHAARSLRLSLAILALVAFAGPGRSPAADPPSGEPVIAPKLQPFVDHHTLAGAVTLVANKDKVLSLEAVGYADVAEKKPMRPDCLFWIASMSKPITGTAFMILVDEGKVKIDDPVEKYLPEFKNLWVAAEQDKEHMVLRRPKQPITIRQILSHTSGMPFSSRMEQPTLDLLPLRLGALSYAMTPLQYEPGTKYQYSNAGINTAGRIIEVVSGMPYEVFLDQRLFKPLGMKDTTFWPNEEQLSRLAKSYRPNAEKNGLQEISITQLHYPLNDRKRQPMPAGGLFSTAADCAKVCQMVLAGGVYDGKRYLSEDAIKQMTSKQTGDAVPNGYGLGWSVGGDTFGHGGAYSTDMTVDRKQGLVFVYMIQHAGFPNGDEAKNIRPTFVKTAVAKWGK